MENKSLISLACLVFLAACECGMETNTPEVIEDDSLRGTAADFIANVGDRVFYDFDKSNITPEAEATLLRQAEWLKQHPERNVLIEGHCDERGTREYNLGLGERRADNAAKTLIEHGIPGERIRTISYGKDRPIVAHGTPDEVHRMNRVSISVIE